MTNIYEFLNSGDVRKYLEDLKYEFSLLEKAFVIYKSKHKSLADKQLAWHELINTTEDVILNENDSNQRYIYWGRCKGRSAHKIIAEYISKINRLVDKFHEEESGAFYTAEAVYAPDLNTRKCDVETADSGIYFSDFVGVRAYIKECFNEKECNWLHGEPRKLMEIRIKKNYAQHFTGNGSERIKSISTRMALCEGKLELTEIRSQPEKEAGEEFGIESDFFGKMWFDIPIPFKRGDIVVCTEANWNNGGEPFVLKQTTPCVIAYNAEDQYWDGVDSSDMNAWGCSGGWEGKYYNNPGMLYADIMADYLDLEYYRGSFPGTSRIVKLMAEAEKKTIGYWEIIKWSKLIYDGKPVGEYLNSLNYNPAYKALAENVLKKDPYIS